METTRQPNRRESTAPGRRPDARAPRILARSMFKDMSEAGLTHEQILGVASELIGLVTHELKENQETKGTA